MNKIFGVFLLCHALAWALGLLLSFFGKYYKIINITVCVRWVWVLRQAQNHTQHPIGARNKNSFNRSSACLGVAQKR